MNILSIYKKGLEYKRNGYHITYYEGSEAINSCGNWKNNFRIGEWRWYHRNGNIAMLINYPGNKNSFIFMADYDTNGKCVGKEYYLVD